MLMSGQNFYFFEGEIVITFAKKKFLMFYYEGFYWSCRDFIFKNLVVRLGYINLFIYSNYV